MSENVEHSLCIKNNASGLGFVASCSCGQKLRRVRGCNRPGRVYALDAAREDFDDHLRELREQEEA